VPSFKREIKSATTTWNIHCQNTLVDFILVYLDIGPKVEVCRFFSSGPAKKTSLGLSSTPPLAFGD